jgi:predicted nucleic acid-binding protein
VIVADTGPLLAAVNRRDPAHQLAAMLVADLGRDLVVPDSVIVEADHLVRRRIGRYAAQALLESLAIGEHRVGHSTPELLRRAVAIDAQYADLDLGICDALVMAYAERHDLPILTFDFAHFRATKPANGHWRLVIDEQRYSTVCASRPT